MSKQLRGICKKAKKTLSSINGQGLVEYALILVLIAIVVITAVKSVGSKTSSTFSAINSSMVTQ